MTAYPDSIPLNWQASYFYLQINPSYAPKGEAALLKLRKLLHTESNFEVEKGLVFAYLYENRMDEAKKQVDKCLSLNPKDALMESLKEALAAGAIHRANAP